MKKQRTGPGEQSGLTDGVLIEIEEGAAITAYVAAQEKCARQAPRMSMGFASLVTDKSVVFRDVTPFFEAADLLEPKKEGKVILIRPRRWGKSVLGTAWLEFLRGRQDLFVGTWAHDKMREEKLIGVHLDLSCGGDSIGECVELLMDSINTGLTLAEQVDGYGEGANGQRVVISADLLKQQPDSSQWALATCTAIVRKLLSQLNSISAAAGRRVALFVDEYDRPCILALNKAELFEDLNKFFQEFYTKLKAISSVVPFLFVTGSSRLAIKGFFSGANDITDLSYDAKAVKSLGYTWAEIEDLYREQLPLLEKLHDMNRDELKAEMEWWYNYYRWSKNDDVKVFNPLSVNMFVKTGEFLAHWTETGAPSLLFNKSLFDGDVMRLLLVKGARIELPWAALIGSGGDGRLHAGLSSSGQRSLLVSSGILTLAPECSARDVLLPLFIPNEEARVQAESILLTTFKPFVTVEVEKAVLEFCADGDAVQLLVALDTCGDVAKCALELAGREKVIEKHVHQAIAALVLAARKDHKLFAIASELGVDKPGEKRKWLDLAFAVRGRGIGYAVELECCEEPKVKENAKSRGLRGKLHHGLEQLRVDYQNFAVENVVVSSRLFSCFLFGKDARLIAYTTGLKHEEIVEVQSNLVPDEDDKEDDICPMDDRIVWL